MFCHSIFDMFDKKHIFCDPPPLTNYCVKTELTAMKCPHIFFLNTVRFAFYPI